MTVTLDIVLDGLRARDQRLGADDLARLMKEVQESLRHIGFVLWTDYPSGPASTIPVEIKMVTELDIVLPARQGSVCLHCELRDPGSTQPDGGPHLEDVDPSLIGMGERALDALVTGLRSLAHSDEYRLPRGFDRRTMRALGRLGPVFERSAEGAELHLAGPEHDTRIEIDTNLLAKCRELSRSAVSAEMAVSGVLVEYSREERSGLLQMNRHFVQLTFGAEVVPEIEQLRGQHVEAFGEALLSPGSDLPSELWLERIRPSESISLGVGSQESLEWAYDRTEPHRFPVESADRAERSAPPKLWERADEFERFADEFARRRAR
jgi:hypothetical protein